ncbi:MAG: hypothetical protein ACKVJX_23570 [Verrucomicrobiia bacterium]|jgi:hypothetical protein
MSFPLRSARNVLLVVLLALAGSSQAAEVVDIGDRRELFIDATLIEKLDGARLQPHAPTPREVILEFDKPWEGLYCGYTTVMKVDDKYRIYYRGMPEARHALDVETTCVAESDDGIHWTKPNLAIYEVKETHENNVVLARHRGCHNLAPFIDTNPNALADQKFKALGGTGAPGLIAFTSPDGLHWTELQKEPVITKGAFDSQNNAFWSESEKQYVCYYRVFIDKKRWIARTTSKDFIHWTDPVNLELDGKPREHLYTNQIHPYPRAPHIYLGLPTRYFPGRRVVTDEEAERIGTPKKWNYVNDCTDILLTTSRGGTDFKRTHLEAFIRPGTDLRNWTSRANYAARGMVQTGPEEMSIYIKHNSGYPTCHMKRYTIRPDGFVSVNAGYAGGEMITKPLTFKGDRLTINFSSSAGGGLRVELQDVDGKAIKGYTLADCPEIIGDKIERTVSWKGGADVSALAGKPIRIRFAIKDADLYSVKFESAK